MKRKALSILLAAMLLVTLITGCAGNGSGTGTTAGTTAAPAATTKATTAAPAATTTAGPALYYNAPGTLPIVNEPITLTAIILQRPAIENRATNEFTKWLEEKTNIHLEFDEVISKEYFNKVNLLIAAGGADLPDLILQRSVGPEDATNWGRAGMVIPLNDYLDTLAYYYPIALNKCSFINYETALQISTSYDGNIYGLLGYAEGTEDRLTTGRVIMYKPWLDQLNMEVPTSLDGLRAYLEAVRDTDMNGNGDLKDEIPLVGDRTGTQDLQNTFITPFLGRTGRYEWSVTDGTVEFNYNTDAYRDGLRYMKALVDDGLLDRLSFTQDEEQVAALLASDSQIVGSFSNISYGIAPLEKQYDYVYATAFSGPSGVRYQGYMPARNNLAWLITKNCEYPEAAFLLGDFMSSEESNLTAQLGVEGRDWRAMDPSKEVNLWDAPNPIRKLTVFPSVQNTVWSMEGVFVNSADYSANMETYINDPNDRDLQRRKAQIDQIKEIMAFSLQDSVISKTVFNEEESVINSDLWAPMSTYIDECFTRFILSDMNIETEWDAYCKTLDTMGLQDVLKIQQSAYDRMYK